MCNYSVIPQSAQLAVSQFLERKEKNWTRNVEKGRGAAAGTAQCRCICSKKNRDTNAGEHTAQCLSTARKASRVKEPPFYFKVMNIR